MDIAKLEEEVEKIKNAITATVKARRADLAPFKVLIEAQRRLAAAKGEAYAIPYDIGFKPEAAYPNPILLATDQQTVLTFTAKRKSRDRKYINAGCAVIEFERCTVTKFGYPNDEALGGHPLNGKGIDLYGVFKVCNSSWIKQITEQNRIAFPNTPDSKQTHFLFTFHENTFECIANGLLATLSNEPYEKIFAEISKAAFKFQKLKTDLPFP
jgi:hypothetical protein